MKHLWETDHAYYCSESNYYAAGNQQPHDHHESWEDFIAEYGNADFDMNLVFRWDWNNKDDEDEPLPEGKGLLKIFWMGQRKGLYRWTTIDVNQTDEDAVRDFLLLRWQHLKALWEGIS